MSIDNKSQNKTDINNYFDEKTLESLGFPMVKKAIIDRTHNEVGKSYATTISPKGSIKEAEEGLLLNISARNFINLYGRLSFYLPDNISETFNKSSKEGAVLSAREIADVRTLISESIKVKTKLMTHNIEYPLLWDLAKKISEQRDLLKHINSILDERDEIRDTATKRLNEIRTNIKDIRDRIYKKLEGYLTGRSYANYITEQAVVIRNERFCIPVRPENTGRIGGIIHSRSSSGETAFLEPYSVVDDNNALASLRSLEEEEIRRILREATEKVGDEKDNLETNIECLSKLDLAFAIGELCLSMPTIMPEIKEGAPLILIKAYNPQLALMAIDEKKKVEDVVVPIDIFLDREKRIAVLSGPNAGGKTVSVKTVGLTLAMAYSGIPVPCGEGTIIPEINDILGDIGEEESIEEALSSFTSHILRLKDILRKATEKSVILLDELGRSTSPDYGSAIGVAVLEHILNIGSYCITTTHYESIKALGATNPAVTNAAVEFSPEDSKPTYRLIWGSYGTSHALETAYNLGLNVDIIKRAREYLGEDKVKLEDIIDEYERRIRELEIIKNDIEEEKRILSEERINLEVEIGRTKGERKELRRERARLVRSVIDEVRKELKDLLKEAKSGGEKEIVRALEKVSSIERQLMEGEEEGKIKFDIDIGSWVRLKDTDTISQIIKIDRDKVRATLLVKGRRIDVPLTELAPIEKESGRNKEGRVKYEISGSVPPEIMVRGMTIDEAIAVLDEHIQRAFLSGLISITIIHGLGTGRLRDGIRAFLRTHPLVSSLRSGVEGEGGDGVTVATLAKKESK
ncbi:MAG: endonuclease MutS2 [bacterium]